MKRLLIILFVTLISISTNAQIIIGAGYNYQWSQYYETRYEKTVYGNEYDGPYFSLKGNIPLNSEFGFETGLNYSIVRGLNYYSAKHIRQCFMIPVTLNYRYAIDDWIKVGANLGFKAIYKISQLWWSNPQKKEKSFWDYELYYPWDYGIQTGLFCDIINHFRINFDFNWGCRDNTNYEDGGGLYTRDISIGLAYIF